MKQSHPPAPAGSSPSAAGKIGGSAGPDTGGSGWGIPARPCVLALLAVLAGLALVACGNQPPAPGWQMDAKDSSERAAQAWLEGDSRLEALEFARARSAVARTGRPDLLARLELLRCASRVAALDIGPCDAFDTLFADAAAAERAYARYIAGQAQPLDAARLPPAHRSLATATAVRGTVLQDIEDPLSRLVAAGVLFQRGLASPDVIAVAVDTASGQGWRRPLLAWLRVQQQRAAVSGASEAAARLQRRIDLLLQTTP
jgi:hypothetical protein